MHNDPSTTIIYEKRTLQVRNYTSNENIGERNVKGTLSRCHDDATDRHWQLSRTSLHRLVLDDTVPAAVGERRG